MNLTAIERETIITMNDQEEWAEVYTSQPSMMTKLDKMCAKDPKHYRCTKTITDSSKGMSKVISKTYRIEQRKLVSFRQAKELTEAQKEAIRKALLNSKTLDAAGDFEDET